MFSVTVSGKTIEELKENYEIAGKLLDHTPEAIRAAMTTIEKDGFHGDVAELDHTPKIEIEIPVPVQNNQQSASAQVPVQEPTKAVTIIPLSEIGPIAIPAAEIEQPTHNDHGVLQAATRPADQDCNGIRWDKRVHSSGKNLQKDGSWRKRRGVDLKLLAEVEAEQKAAAQPATPPPAVPGATTLPIINGKPWTAKHEAEYQASVKADTAAAVVPVVATPLPQPVIGSGHTLETFTSNIVVVVADLIEKGKITHDYVRQLCGFFEVGEIYEVFNDSAKARQLFEEFAKNGLIVKVA